MTPTDKQKITQYEHLLHLIQMYSVVVMDAKAVAKLISNINTWSYAHRVGNGQYDDESQQRIIDNAFWKLTEIK